ncbi:SAP domain-containing protein [Veillonella caviae]|uniref:SAP domain-containing protein n=1 Tax=Veillonella caviae TaxID=248316 RepID=UPI00235802B7|nr:SAP domain-containing protein [Veillonella caviae]
MEFIVILVIVFSIYKIYKSETNKTINKSKHLIINTTFEQQEENSNEYKSRYQDAPREVRRNIQFSSLLNAINGRNAKSDFPYYFTERYSPNWQNLVQKLIENGYLQFASPIDALQYLIIPELKSILKNNNLKLSGKKSELIERIKNNIPIDKIEHLIPLIYQATVSGEELIKQYEVYIMLENSQYNLSEIYATKQELERLNQNTSTDNIIQIVISNNILRNSQEKNWSDFMFNYYDLSIYQTQKSNYSEALNNLMRFVYMNLTGLSRNNTVESYTLLLIPPAAIRNTDKLMQKLLIDNNEFNERFIENASELDKIIPFTYFDKYIALEIYKDALKEPDLNMLRYKKYANKPNPNSKLYKYYEFNY